MENNEHFYARAIHTALRISFIALLIYWSFLIIKPFVLVVVWGIIISIALFPLFEKLTKKLGNRKKLASIIITTIGLLILTIPSVIMVKSTAESLSEISTQMKEGSLNIPPPKEDVAEWPVVGKSIYHVWQVSSENIEKATQEFKPQLQKIAPKILDTAKSLSGAILLFMVSIIIAGILFVVAEPAAESAKSIFNTLVGEQGNNFVQLSASIIRSVVQGILGIASIQSLLGGIGMFVVGIPGAGIWTIILFFVAIVQLPPILVMGPIAAYSFTITDTTPAIIFSIYAIFVSISDTFLKPLLLGRGVDVPMLVVLLGAIGGMILSGIIGLFIGAVVLSITYKIFEAILVDDVLSKPNKDIETEQTKTKN
jgi:predicted PurR-regulated permease PerM